MLPNSHKCDTWAVSPLQEAVDNVGPVDDGTESLGDVPSLSEEITGIVKDDHFCHICLSCSRNA